MSQVVTNFQLEKRIEMFFVFEPKILLNKCFYEHAAMFFFFGLKALHNIAQGKVLKGRSLGQMINSTFRPERAA